MGLMDWLDDRAGLRGLARGALEEPVRGGASFAYVFGSVLTFIFLLQAVTGVFLAMYYSPSSTDAWASVAYIQDQANSGWFIRGLHHHGASAMVLVAALHMLQTAIYGAYKKPRELNWIIGVLMLGLILAFALTGYLLPWDQTGYWATKVATNIAGSTPMAGQTIAELAQGGNDYGNLTLTRFFAIHVFILPGALAALTVAHIYLFRRHGQTPPWNKSDEELDKRTEPFWPGQMFRDMVAMSVVFAILVAINIVNHGVGLDAPADPASAFQARPEWYFRPLFQVLEYFSGPMVKVVELGLPAVIGGVLIGLPFVDRGDDRSPRRRAAFLAVLGVGVVVAILLTVLSFRADANDPKYSEQQAESEKRATLARKLAIEHGVPAAVGYAVFNVVAKNDRAAAAKALWDAECAGCHQGGDRSGPEIGPGYNSRAWFRAFLLDPSGERFFGRTGINKMKPVEIRGEELDAVIEWLYSETGASDANAKLAANGKELADDGECSACHEFDGETDGTAPNLGGRGTEAVLTKLIGMPSHELYFGDSNEMPEYYDKYNGVERQAVATWLVSLRDLPFPEKGEPQKPRPAPAAIDAGTGAAAIDATAE